MATVETNKVKIEKLEDDLKSLAINSKNKKLPAKIPGVYKREDGSFRKYALQVENYLKIMGVETENRSNVLLTFLSPEDFENVTRIYDFAQLKSDEFEKTVNHIAKVLDENLTEAASMAKLLNTKQGNMTMQQFLKKLEGYANQAFPESSMSEARERCLISALTTNCKSKALSFQIYTFVNSKLDGSKPSFNEVAMKAIELSSILGAYDENDDEADRGTGISVFHVKSDENPKNIKRCHICMSDQHLKASCPQNTNKRTNGERNNYQNNSNKKDWGQNSGEQKFNGYNYGGQKYNGQNFNGQNFNGQNFSGQNFRPQNNFGRNNVFSHYPRQQIRAFNQRRGFFPQNGSFLQNRWNNNNGRYNNRGWRNGGNFSSRQWGSSYPRHVNSIQYRSNNYSNRGRRRSNYFNNNFKYNNDSRGRRYPVNLITNQVDNEDNKPGPSEPKNVINTNQDLNFTWEQTTPNKNKFTIAHVLDDVTGSQGAQPQIICEINGYQINATLDTGSFKSILSSKLAEKLNIAYQVPNPNVPNLQGVSGTSLEIAGVANVSVKIDGKNFKIEFFVIKNIVENTLLLGLEFLKSGGLVLNFAENTLSNKKENNDAIDPKLKSKIFVNGNYNVTPFSSEIVFAKINTDDVIENQIECCNLELSLQGSFENQLIYQVRNNSDKTVQLDDDDILGVSYSTTERKIVRTDQKLTPGERAKIVYTETKIDKNELLSDEQKKILWMTILENNKAFAITENDIGSIANYAHSFTIKNEQELLKGNKVYPCPLKLLKLAKIELDRLEKLNVIERCVSKYSIPSFFVHKKGVDKVRLLTDFRHMNSQIIPEVANITATEILLTTLQEKEAKVFAVLDLKDAYYSIWLKEECREYCSFNIPSIGSYRYLRVPLGISNAPAAMSFIIQKILADQKDLLSYMDDVLIFGKNVENLISTFCSVLKILHDNGFMINYKKLKIAVKTATFLGFEVSEMGISPLNDKLQAIRLLPPPTSKKSLQSVLGALSYYRKYIEMFSSKARGLIDCLKINKDENGKLKPFKLTEEGKQSFEILKKSLMEAPVLKLPDVTKKFYLTTDGSLTGVGSCLSQIYDGIHMPIAYYSRSLNAGQRNYNAFLRELLAIVTSIHHFSFYLQGQTFEVRTDSETLCKKAFLTKCQIRIVTYWLLEITGRYDFTITYLKGKDNQLADMLSRDERKNLPPVESSKLNEWFETNFGEKLKQDNTVNLINRNNDDNSVNEDIFDNGDGTENNPIDIVEDSEGIFVQKQLEDEKLSYIISILESDDQTENFPDMLAQYRRFKHFLTINKSGLLCIKWFEIETEKWTLKIVAPETTIDKILDDVHCNPTAGHMSSEKTLEKVRELFWFPNMTKIIKAYCESCAVCHKGNISFRKNERAPLKFWESGGRPASTICIDIFECGRHTSTNKYIFIIVDKFSHFVHFDILDNSRAPSIAKSLLKYFFINGIPSKIMSDLGPNLQSKIINELLNVLKIHRLRTTPYHPMSNGLAERAIRSLKHLLIKYVSENPKTYPDTLNMLEYALNTSICSTTKISPFFLQRGYRPRSLGSIAWGVTSNEYYVNKLHYCTELYKTINKIYTFALVNTKNKEITTEGIWDQRVNYTKYTPGQRVYFLSKIDNKLPYKKLRSPFIKAEIITAYPSDCYLIKTMVDGRTFMASYDKLTLIPYHIRENGGGLQMRGDDTHLSQNNNTNSDDEDEFEIDTESDEEPDEQVENLENQPQITQPRRGTRARTAPERFGQE